MRVETTLPFAKINPNHIMQDPTNHILYQKHSLLAGVQVMQEVFPTDTESLMYSARREIGADPSESETGATGYRF